MGELEDKWEGLENRWEDRRIGRRLEDRGLNWKTGGRSGGLKDRWKGVE